MAESVETTHRDCCGGSHPVANTWLTPSTGKKSVAPPRRGTRDKPDYALHYRHRDGLLAVRGRLYRRAYGVSFQACRVAAWR
ncbi:unnamed protein product [Danaus chrysippus]|uniref:(African queen) hypothetical protein n=1 Tax=Danaus chrysippus TaxID=151541 RepID=A0A8J2QUT8_9NEOP|nr:unnamed protein product [Danaus chrysippus]